MSTTFAQWLTDKNQSNVPRMGFLVWYSLVGDAGFELADVTKHAADTKAPVKLPKPSNPGDVFRRGCTAAQRSRSSLPYPNDPALKVNYKLKDTGHDEQEIYKAVVREVVDAKNHVIDHQSIGNIVFDRTLLDTKSQPIHADDEFDSIVTEVRDYVAANLRRMTGDAVRTLFRKALEGTMKGVCVRPGGGVYFIKEDQSGQLAALDQFASHLPGLTFHYMVCEDDSKQREMLRNAYEAETVDAIESLIGQINIAMSSGTKLRKKTVLGFYAQFEEHRDRLATYSALLNETLTRSEAGFDLLGQQVMNLMETIDDNDDDGASSDAPTSDDDN